jgi:arylsulfatase
MLNFIPFSLLIGFLFFASKPEPVSDAKPKPNIVFIFADDLGYGELGCYGQKKIETPNLDSLAAGGMLFTDFYSAAPVCAPARCMLMTGMHSGHAYIRGNDELADRGPVWDYQAVFADSSLEGQRPIPDSLWTIAEALKSNGYKTGCVGKWGLGAPGTEGVPNKQGFDYFFGYNCQRQAHNLYPGHLWENEQRVYLNNELVAPHSNLAPDADPNDPESYARFTQTEYAPDLMYAKALEFLEQNQDQPFFLYYPSPLPHLPLQAPQEWVNHYREKFGPEAPYTEKSYFPNQFPNATYAAMISCLDAQVGGLVAKLKELGIYENTLIVFTSDNGPTYTGGVDVDYFNSGGPFRADYGWGKGFVQEAGIRVPMIAHWSGHIEPGSKSELPSILYDVFPTLCELTASELNASDGISFLPTLLGMPGQKRHAFLYWEFPEYKGQQAIRIGPWKGVRKNMHEGNQVLALFNLAQDPREEHDLSALHPDIVEIMETHMQSAHIPSPIKRFKFPVLGD